MDIIVNLIIEGLKTTKLVIQSYDLPHIKTKAESIFEKFDKKTLDIISKYLSSDTSIISICIKDMEAILEDGKFGLNDIVFFLDIIKNIYIKIGSIISTITCPITSEFVIDLCVVILNIILILVVVEQQQLAGLQSMVGTATEMIKLTFPTIKKLLCCC